MPRRRSGPSAQAAEAIVRQVSNDALRELAEAKRKLSLLRALFLAVHNDPNITVVAGRVGTNFFSVVGEVLEGRTFEQLDLYAIDPKRVLLHVKGD